jgi:hypothetical protein
MKKIKIILLVTTLLMIFPATKSYANEPELNRYVQLKDGVVFAYVESSREVGNSILLSPGLTWENVKEKRYENGNFVDATAIKTVTEVVDNKVAQINTTVFASDAKGDVVSQDVQLGWHKDSNGTYASSAPQPSQPSDGSFNRTTIQKTGQDTVTAIVNIIDNDDTTITFTKKNGQTVTTYNGAATLSINEKSNHEITTYVEPNGLKVTKFLEKSEAVTFDNPKSIEQINESLNNNSTIKKYLNIFFQLLDGWKVTPIIK